MHNETVPPDDPWRFVSAIEESGLTIYDKIEVGDHRLWIPTLELEVILDTELRGISLTGLPLRTRSKVVKEHICRALRYPVPSSFKKTRPRFPGQILDTYVQKSNNLQVWNEELTPTRRYAIIRVSADDVIIRVKVVTGDTLALLDTTGTLTQKYQARCIPGTATSELVVRDDTAFLSPFVSPPVVREDAALLRPFISPEAAITDAVTSVIQPKPRGLLPIAVIYEKLTPLLGQRFPDSGVDQERNRRDALHRLVCGRLGYSGYQDDGQFPDVRHQLLEVKLQTAPTIDLGFVAPD